MLARQESVGGKKAIGEGDEEVQNFSCKINEYEMYTVGNIVNNYVIYLYGDIS